MDLNQSLGFLLNSGAKLMKRQLDSKLRAYQITSSQWAVLKLLSQNDKLSQVEIAQAIKTDKATCGAIIDKLIKKEFVKRTISQQDQRARIIEISPLALSVTDELTSLAEETNTEALMGIKQKEQEIFIKTLEQLTINLENKEI